jgi:hypothetical protein
VDANFGIRAMRLPPTARRATVRHRRPSEREDAMLRIVKSVGIAIALGWITSQMILRAQRK